MIQKTFGNIQILITDSSFGNVIPGDETFLDRYKKTTSISLRNLAWMNQVHGSNVEHVCERNPSDILFPSTDGMVTDEPGRLLITKTADCVPILLWSIEAQIVAVLHCGWKGFFKGIIESFAEDMNKKGFDVEYFSAFIGPHLRVLDFQVREDFIEQIPKDKKKYLHHTNNLYFYDMTLGVSETLESLGIKDVYDSDVNTYDDPDYFSYRKWCKVPKGERLENYSTFASTIFIFDKHAEKT